MKILFYFGHPSQYFFMKYTIKILKEKGHSCAILIKSKDVLQDLLLENNEEFTNILPEGRKNGKIGLLIGLIKRNLRLIKYIRGKDFHLLIGTDPSLAQVGFLKKIPVITVLEDDINVVPELAKVTFPFTSLIMTPEGCRMGKYESKTIHYKGYMKLAYLHPNQFIKKVPILNQPYFLIRLSKLDAYHDNCVSGFTLALVKKVVSLLESKGTVYISAEGNLDDALQRHKLEISPSQMQQILVHANMLISNSQSMTMEACMLGIPSIRYSEFAGKISVLDELENKYDLTYGIPPNDSTGLIKKVNELLSFPDIKIEFQRRRSAMLKDKIDVTSFFVWFIEKFPESAEIMKQNTDYQSRFF